jgi:hypothetical protein
MRRMLYLSLFFLVGCQNLIGPRDRRGDTSRPDLPWLPIEEQKQLGRERYALPETSRNLVPRDYSDFTGPHNPSN